MLDAFKLKPFDLEPVLATWTDGPMFYGKPKKDMPVDQWLDKIKDGCTERKVPKEVWHRVGEYFMGDAARKRLDELKAVMSKVHGGSYRWDWKKFKLAMMNMGWNISSDTKETLKVRAKASGSWWITRKKSSEGAAPAEAPEPEPPRPSRTASWIVNKNTDIGAPPPVEKSGTMVKRSLPKRSKSMLLPIRDKSPTPPLPVPARRGSVSDSSSLTTIAQAPLWLLNASEAMDILISEHPKVMTTLSAILITVGSIPAIPAISAGAGGVFLASSAAHTAGAIAVGLGSWIKAQQSGKVSITDGKSAASH